MNERPMRRGRQALTEAQAETILRNATSGVLSLCGHDGEPYGVPLSHVYADGKLYFHCATEGYKMDLIGENPRASFCVVERDEVHPESYTTHYRSVIAFGTLRIVAEDAGKIAALQLLGRRFAPNDEAGLEAEISRLLARVAVLEMQITRLSGKEAKELVALRPMCRH